jgi:hypothetical protein
MKKKARQLQFQGAARVKLTVAMNDSRCSTSYVDSLLQIPRLIGDSSNIDLPGRD